MPGASHTCQAAVVAMITKILMLDSAYIQPLLTLREVYGVATPHTVSLRFILNAEYFAGQPDHYQHGFRQHQNSRLRHGRVPNVDLIQEECRYR